jgi:3-oxoacyl-[acyl-carrier-protein] synthase II
MSDNEKTIANKVVVTGIGVMTSNGVNKNEFFANCCDGISGLKKCTLFDTSNISANYFGQILKDYPYLPNTLHEKERIQYIVEDCLQEMLIDAKLTKEYISSLQERAYLSFATSLGTHGRLMSFTKDMLQGNYEPTWLIEIARFLPRIKESAGIEGGCYTTTSACAASTTAAGIAFDLIKNNKADLVIVGGVDPLSEFSCYGFNALKALSTTKCKPFDKKRDGLSIGEGGAFLVFESLVHAQNRKANIYAEILGYGINNDAYHITSPDPNGEGAFLSMSMAINEGKSDIENIDYINAHGTGTALNDEMEINTIHRLFEARKKKLLVSSTKSMIGHCLAAAGALELVVTVLSIYNGVCTKNVNLEEAIKDYENIELLTETINIPIRQALSNSFAFAGNTASILVSSFT